MIPENEIKERLYRNRMLLLEAERERLYRAASDQERRPELIRRIMGYLAKGLILAGTWLEAKYDSYNLHTADRSC